MGKAAQYMGVSRPTMWRMIRDGRLEKVEILPGSHRMRRADLDKYVEEHGTSGTRRDAVPAQNGNSGEQAA
ncbi:MAG: helix-turn-helix domain-containing protein [Kiritimatiellae bacterium]|nr:helix-turn-helix domain-containing protein [Kiritimatiellia bacterium]